MKSLDGLVPVCPQAHAHYHIRLLYKRWGKAGMYRDEQGRYIYYATITEGDPCTWYITKETDDVYTTKPIQLTPGSTVVATHHIAQHSR